MTNALSHRESYYEAKSGRTGLGLMPRDPGYTLTLEPTGTIARWRRGERKRRRSSVHLETHKVLKYFMGDLNNIGVQRELGIWV